MLAFAGAGPKVRAVHPLWRLNVPLDASGCDLRPVTTTLEDLVWWWRLAA
jgi:hypothetical protein